MDDLPLPEITPQNEPYWKGLESGRLMFQRCANGHAWLPVRVGDGPSAIDGWVAARLLEGFAPAD